MKNTQTFKTLVTSMVLASGIFVSTSADANAAKAFTDLSNNGIHTEAVNYLNSINAFDFKVGNQINGKEPVTRAEVSAILYSMSKVQLSTVRTYNNNFKDVNANTQYADAIIWSYEVGIFGGDNKNNFNPNGKLTRAEMSKILVNAFKLQSAGKSTFKDIKTNHWAYKYINILASNEVSKGDGKGNYLPKNNVTTNELSSFIFRILNGNVVVETPSTKPETSKPPVSNSGSGEFKSFGDIKNIMTNLYNDPSKDFKETIVYTKTDMEEQLINYHFNSADFSQEVKGYTWYGRTFQTSSEKVSEGKYKVTLYVFNNRNAEQHSAWVKRMDKAEKAIVDNYKLETDYDVIYAINDFIGSNISYGTDIPSDNPYMVRGEENTTCNGYTDFAAELYKRFGIESRLVQGTEKHTGFAHSWNAVKVGGNWYYSDATGYDSADQKNEKYLLMTNAEGSTPMNTNFKVSNVEFNQSMAKPYTYKK
ncbi:hypothetical protein CSE16_09740 [Solibacillus sp. R5-41]|uniref:S-layer homology domain-containing protein n=1 Tax=Solibacillus sp. R5-41 TaxID=2048654 RepID=UPI000C125589|nr:S-layer homology domain-containing protein [Solibacillus sp. R5-41]ATP40304.1 hypothetical protein CSE16_09740 [Solibacillus sp. R5-41]